MLKGLVATLLVANGLMLAWALGWLDGLPGLNRHHEREPERIGAQVNPHAVELIAPSAASATIQAAAAALRDLPLTAPAATAPAIDSSATAPPGERLACLEAGPFAATEVAAAERGLRALQLPALNWIHVRSERGGAFIVYQGKFADDAAAAKRREELRRQQIDTEELRSSPELRPGLSFGRYDSRATAEAAAESLQQRGVKTARAVTITPPVVVTLLRVDGADAALAARLSQLTLPPAGSGFKPCVTPP